MRARCCLSCCVACKQLCVQRHRLHAPCTSTSLSWFLRSDIAYTWPAQRHRLHVPCACAHASTHDDVHSCTLAVVAQAVPALALSCSRFCLVDMGGELNPQQLAQLLASCQAIIDEPPPPKHKAEACVSWNAGVVTPPDEEFNGMPPQPTPQPPWKKQKVSARPPPQPVQRNEAPPQPPLTLPKADAPPPPPPRLLPTAKASPVAAAQPTKPRQPAQPPPPKLLAAADGAALPPPPPPPLELLAAAEQLQPRPPSTPPPPKEPMVALTSKAPTVEETRPSHLSSERWSAMVNRGIPLPPPPKVPVVGASAAVAPKKPHGPRGENENSAWHTAWHRAKRAGPEALALFNSVWPKPKSKAKAKAE